MLIQFSHYFETTFGFSLYLIGSVVELGHWQIQQAIQMKYVEKNTWITDVFINSLDNIVEYKYFVALTNNPQEQIQWLDGNNLKLELSKLNNQDNSFNVMTFNIRFDTEEDNKNQWQFRKEIVIDMIKSHSPIILGLQEVLNHQKQYLIEHLNNYNMIGRGRRKEYWNDEGCPIFYRMDYQLIKSEIFWLSQTPDIPESNQYGNNIPRICTYIKIKKIIQNVLDYQIEPKVIHIYNCHFDHSNSESQVKAAIQIKQHIQQVLQDKENVIVMGDLNCLPFAQPIDILVNQGQKLINTIGKLDIPFATFHSWYGFKLGLHIDYIFIDKDTKLNWMKIDNKHYEGQYPSDHFPKIVNLEI